MKSTDSILKTIRANRFHEGYDVFDTQLILAINSAIFDLNEVVELPDETFVVSNDTATWGDLLSDELFNRFVTVPQYIDFKVRLYFDPPKNSFAIEAIERQLTRMEHRLSNVNDYIKEAKGNE